MHQQPLGQTMKRPANVHNPATIHTARDKATMSPMDGLNRPSWGKKSKIRAPEKIDRDFWVDNFQSDLAAASRFVKKKTSNAVDSTDLISGFETLRVWDLQLLAWHQSPVTWVVEARLLRLGEIYAWLCRWKIRLEKSASLQTCKPRKLTWTDRLLEDKNVLFKDCV